MLFLDLKSCDAEGNGNTLSCTFHGPHSKSYASLILFTNNATVYTGIPVNISCHTYSENFQISFFTGASKDIGLEESWSIFLIAGLAAGMVGALLLCLLALLIWRRQRRRTRAENPLSHVPLRVINPSKKNSLNRRNDPGPAMRFEKLKMLEKGEEDEEEDDMDLMFQKSNLNNARNMGLRDELLKGEPRLSFNQSSIILRNTVFCSLSVNFVPRLMRLYFLIIVLVKGTKQ